ADAVDAEGLRAVDHAARAGRWPLVALLDPSYPLPVAENAGVETDIDTDIDTGSESGSESGSEAGADPGPVAEGRDPRERLAEALAAGRYDHDSEALARGLSPAELATLLLEAGTRPSPERIAWLLD